MARLERTLLTNRDTAFRHEWLETNGRGAYALGTASGLATRRYHGLLIAATRPPAERSLLLSKIDESVSVGDTWFELGINRYRGDVIHPSGDALLASFTSDPFPTWEYELGGARLRKTIALVQGEDAVIVRWELLGTGVAGVQLEARPLVAFRSHHALANERESFRRDLIEHPGRLVFEPEAGLPALHFSHDARQVVSDGYWYRQFRYQVEKERGYDCEEDLFNPCAFVTSLAPGKTFTIVASTSGCGVGDASRLLERERTRRRAFAVYVSPSVALLKRAADQFLVRRGEGYTVIAGYPWFTDWGRDTMISLPGLTLSTRRHDVARSILETFARHVSQGLIPNRFPDAEGDAPEYNTIDATLWMFQAARAYIEASGDDVFAERITPLFEEILEEHQRGTRHGIHVAEDGLLSGGEPGAALTWMDARIDGAPVTPRAGKAVEIQALWYGAVRITAELLRRSDPASARAARLEDLAQLITTSFRALFWNGERGRLADVVAGDGEGDASLRPNQLLAISLPHPLLDGEDARRVLDSVREQLLTPFGLRTLAPGDPSYRPRYEGGTAERDGSYHQGTVWPWLIGPYVDALFAIQGESDATREEAAALVTPLLSHLRSDGLGQLPEVFDGSAPHRPGGCPAQAWSVAELLRVVTRYRIPV